MSGAANSQPESFNFWAIVKNQLPDYLKRKEWLKRAGGLLE
jgi:predicted metal-dependent hydrolase